MNTWNILIKARDKAKNMIKDDPDNESLKDIVKKTELYLGQINTSAGRRVIPEANNYIQSIHEFLTL